MFLIPTKSCDAQGRFGILTDASAVMTVVPKTFVHAHASTGNCDLNPIDTVVAAISVIAASVSDKMIRST